MNSPVKLLYIAGWGRSGTTILDNILGQLEGFFSAGELRYVWERNVIQQRVCGCGEPFRDCAIWRQAFEEACGGFDEAYARDMALRLRTSLSDARLPLTVLRDRLSGGRHMAAVRDDLDRLYAALARAASARVIVDSSKVPGYAWLVGTLPSVRPYVVHFVRDPRAVAHSWTREKMQADTGTLMKRRRPLDSAARWALRNLEVDALVRRGGTPVLRVRYEDFVAGPEATVRDILSFVGEAPPRVPIEGRSVELGVTHTSSGNPNRFRRGTVELRMDEEWRSAMSPSTARAIRLLTAPLMSRYGYGGSAA